MLTEEAGEVELVLAEEVGEEASGKAAAVV